MAYDIRLHRGAAKALVALDSRTRSRIRVAIDRLAESPRPSGVVKLAASQNAYRVRVGSYRVLYRIYDAELVIFVIDIDHRSRIYR